MHRYNICAVTLFLAGTVAIAQTKITTAEEHAKTMQSNAEIGGAMNAALIGNPSRADARKLLAALRQNFVALQTFWTERKRGDAVAILKDGVSRIDAMDKMLSTNIDLEVVQKASQEFGGATCAACHKQYREGSARTGFRFKEGVF